MFPSTRKGRESNGSFPLLTKEKRLAGGSDGGFEESMGFHEKIPLLDITQVLLERRRCVIVVPIQCPSPSYPESHQKTVVQSPTLGGAVLEAFCVLSFPRKICSPSCRQPFVFQVGDSGMETQSASWNSLLLSRSCNGHLSPVHPLRGLSTICDECGENDKVKWEFAIHKVVRSLASKPSVLGRFDGVKADTNAGLLFFKLSTGFLSASKYNSKCCFWS